MSEIEEWNGCKFYAQDDMILSWLRANPEKAYEPETVKFISYLPTGVALDIGAATGWYALAMAKVGHRVVAMECNPAVLARLHANIELNKLGDCVRVVEAGASSKSGFTKMYYNPAVPLTSGASIQAPTCAKPALYTVEIMRVDDLNLPKLDFIKIDVENHEMAVLEGAAETILRHRPVIVLEANTDKLRAALVSQMTAFGYTCVVADERNLLCRPV